MKDKDVHIKFLEESLGRFNNAKMRKGYLKKKAERDDEERTMENEILIVENYFRRNDELHQAFIDDHLGFAYEEALSERYFSRDMRSFVENLKRNE